LAANNFPSLEELVPTWNATVNVFVGPNLSNTNAYYASIFQTIGEKAEQGFNVSISDVLGRLFSAEFVQGPNGGVAKTFSDIQVFHV